jgi:beta-aspartyl-peptidase (threonine type)
VREPEAFADSLRGFSRAGVAGPEAKALYVEQLRVLTPKSIEGENTKAMSGDERYRQAAIELVKVPLSSMKVHGGTINIIALDRSGEPLCMRVSTKVVIA